LCGTLAITAVVPFSGFYSKDAILARAAEQGAYGKFALGIAIAVLTSFYMFRLFLTVFCAATRSEHANRTHESPPVMLFPLRILAVMSIVGGFIGAENVLGIQFDPPGARQELSIAQQLVAPFVHAPWACSFGLIAALLGLG